MRTIRTTLYLALALSSIAQTPPAQPAQGGRGGRGAGAPGNSARKRILVIGAAKGFEHDSITDAMAEVWKMGHDTGLWEAYLRTDYELITKGPVGRNGKI